MRVALAADHHGVALKARLVERLSEQGHTIFDAGSHDPDEIVDYPPLCAVVSRRVAARGADLAIVIGGSGQGEAIACNKIPGIRAGVAYSRFAVEISRGVPSRPTKVRSRSGASCCSSYTAVISEVTSPGAIALTRIPRRPVHC